MRELRQRPLREVSGLIESEIKDMDELLAIERTRNAHLDRIADNLGTIANYLREIHEAIPQSAWARR